MNFFMAIYLQTAEMDYTKKVQYVFNDIIRVATRQGKVREIEIFSRSGNCTGILQTVREIWKYSQMSGNCQGILKI